METFDPLAQPLESSREHTAAITLSVEECRSLLSGTHVGRVAVSIGALPAIFPVRYLMHDDAIWFRAANDGALLRACSGSVVAFEIDGCDDSGSFDRSVLVRGIAEEVVDPVRLESVEPRWFTGSSHGPGIDRYLALPITIVSGLRYV